MSIFTRFDSPLGEILLIADGAGGLQRLALDAKTEPDPDPTTAHRDDEALRDASGQVQGYLEGRRRSFSLTLAPGGTEPQRQVWSALLRIPYGETRTYGELAQRQGGDQAPRSISAASNANPLPILIPCHRVVATDGPGSYRCGVALKERLLTMEREAALALARHIG
ncbi:methylated-DNA--[protein]-cysteine S-methyltransferase [Billgrantia endophytica]|nr:methylated-DNA--[protein]-cysteine S-methyltransferase [Halomonas endophytica]